MAVDSELFSRVIVVLHRPKSPGNVGSVARAMKNMGFASLALADPIAFDDPSYFDTEARRLAWDAADIVQARREEPTLAAALAGCTLVAGTSSRPATGARVLDPPALAAALVTHLKGQPSGRAALLLGQEDIGLTPDAQALCHIVGSVDTAPAYPSLNLAQAALLFLYEMRRAMLEAPSPGTESPEDNLPSHAAIEACLSRAQEALEAIDFFQGTAREHMMRDLRALSHRALLSTRELAIAEGIVHRILWLAKSRRDSGP